jgi:type II secretory pathway pseudopilin PulG
LKIIHNRGKKALTIIESLVSITLLSIFVLGLVGSFFIAKSGASKARHRHMVMNLLDEWMGIEARAGYDGGSGQEADYYANPLVTSPDPVPVTVGDVTVNIQPDPYYPNNIENSDGSQIAYHGVPYKIVGFIATWTEPGGQTCSERVVTHVSYHSSF